MEKNYQALRAKSFALRQKALDMVYRAIFSLGVPIIRLQVFLHKGFAALFTPPLRYKLFS